MVKKKIQNHDKNSSTEHAAHSSSSSSDTITLNYWMIASVVLAVLLVVSFFIGGSPSISTESAGQKVVDFAKEQGASASVISVEEEGSLFKVTVSIDGQEVPVYVTSDGARLVPSVIELDSSTTTNTNTETSPKPTNIPKSDRPSIELFVMSHCPYGTQVEKGILPVVKTLEDKIDFEVKFVYYAMHGEIEVYEQLNQYCIQKEQNEKYLPYLTCFLEDGNSERCLAATGINTAALETCTVAADKEFSVTANFENQASWLSGRFPLFDISKADNAKYDVGGSPTLIINGVEAQVGRDSQSLLNAVCGAFNTAPEECNTQFAAGTPAPGFGFGTVETSNNVAAGCGY